jgi:hypothetical protein
MKPLKFVILFLFITSGLTLNLNGQAKFEPGIKLGVNFANLSGGPHELSSRTGIFAGISMEINIESWPVSIEPGVFYSQKGAEGQYKETIIKGAYEGNAGTFKLDYIEVPILAKYRFATESALKPYIMGGPYIEFNLNSEVKASKNVAYLEDISAEIKSTGFGLLAGVGSDFHINGRKFNIQARYGVSLNPVYENRSDEGEKHRVFNISAGFVF